MKFIIITRRDNPSKEEYQIYGESPMGGFVDRVTDLMLISWAADRVAFWLDVIEPAGETYIIDLSGSMSASKNAEPEKTALVIAS